MRLICYPLLNLRSQKAILRVRKKWGHPYRYNPRKQLITRLSEQLQMSETEIVEQLEREREFLLRNRRYFV